MYIEKLNIENLKLLRNLELDFRGPQGLRKWTVLIGRNGTAKTSILQAIALAAAGQRHVTTLARPVARNLRDRRPKPGEERAVRIDATFKFADAALEIEDVFPGLTRPYPEELHLRSEVTLPRGGNLLAARSWYEAGTAVLHAAPSIDPLDVARDQRKPFWFVAAYGVARHLPDAGNRPKLDFPELDRLMPLFDLKTSLTSTAFANYFVGAAPGELSDDQAESPESTDKARMYSRMLKAALFKVKDLLSPIVDLELRGSWKPNTEALQERAKFVQRLGGSDYPIPAVALSHGYQSTIAWIADLIGHVVLETDRELEPEEMRGLVLIDEIDLYLHPTWQVVLVRALRETFPEIQFVVTTHSPLVLASLNPDQDQVVRLEHDEETGDVKRVEVHEDPRLLTGTELLRLYFDLEDIHPDRIGRLLRDFRYLAANPYRTEEDDRKLVQWLDELKKEGVEPHFTPVPRKPFVRRSP